MNTHYQGIEQHCAQKDGSLQWCLQTVILVTDGANKQLSRQTESLLEKHCSALKYQEIDIERDLVG
jgi:hypothetical protein